MVTRPSKRLLPRARVARGTLGLTLAIIALWARLFFPILPSTAAAAGGGDNAAALFGEHALCLAGQAGEAPAPANPQPPPVTHDGAACCPLHGAVGFILPPNPPSLSIAWVALAAKQPHYDAPVVRRLNASILGARAPPLIA